MRPRGVAAYLRPCGQLLPECGRVRVSPLYRSLLLIINCGAHTVGVFFPTAEIRENPFSHSRYGPRAIQKTPFEHEKTSTEHSKCKIEKSGGHDYHGARNLRVCQNRNLGRSSPGRPSPAGCRLEKPQLFPASALRRPPGRGTAAIAACTDYLQLQSRLAERDRFLSAERPANRFSSRCIPHAL